MNLALTVEMFERPGRARVERAIAAHQKGRVYFEGSYWPARFYTPNHSFQAEAASWVTVVGRQGVTLLVHPLKTAVSISGSGRDPIVSTYQSSEGGHYESF